MQLTKGEKNKLTRDIKAQQAEIDWLQKHYDFVMKRDNNPFWIWYLGERYMRWSFERMIEDEKRQLKKLKELRHGKAK